jgi:hypothetical protein
MQALGCFCKQHSAHRAILSPALLFCPLPSPQQAPRACHIRKQIHQTSRKQTRAHTSAGTHCAVHGSGSFAACFTPPAPAVCLCWTHSSALLSYHRAAGRGAAPPPRSRQFSAELMTVRCMTDSNRWLVLASCYLLAWQAAEAIGPWPTVGEHTLPTILVGCFTDCTTGAGPCMAVTRSVLAQSTLGSTCICLRPSDPRGSA